MVHSSVADEFIDTIMAVNGYSRRDAYVYAYGVLCMLAEDTAILDHINYLKNRSSK